MLLILEDNIDKLSLLCQRFRDRLTDQMVVVCNTVAKAQYMVQKLTPCEIELWLDEDLGAGGSGFAFLTWLIEFQEKIDFLLIITLSMRSKDQIEALAKAAKIPYRVWAGPFS